VRNRPDGSVEALFKGEAGAVERMIAACRTGPRMARVAEVVSNAASAPGVIRGFMIRDDD
jgi:acylphosphatase